MATDGILPFTPSGIPLTAEELENLLCELERIYGNGKAD